MVTRTKAVMIVLPAFMVVHWSLTLDYRFPDWYYHALCYEQYNVTFWRFYFGFTTFIISSMRYIFIVYNEKVLLIGKEKVKRIFYFLSIFVPLMMTILHACVLPVPPSAHNISQKTCYKYLEVSHNMTCPNIHVLYDNCDPILPLVLEHLPTYVTKLVGITVKIMYVIMCTNVIEGILYWKIFKTIRA